MRAPNVLIIDDDEMMCKALSTLVERTGRAVAVLVKMLESQRRR